MPRVLGVRIGRVTAHHLLVEVARRRDTGQRGSASLPSEQSRTGIPNATLQEEKGSLDEEGREREMLYERAERLSSSLVSMGQQLTAAIEGVNTAAASSLGDPTQPIGKLVKILNNQLLALTHLDARTDDLTAKVQSLSMGARSPDSSVCAEEVVRSRRAVVGTECWEGIEEPAVCRQRSCRRLLSGGAVEARGSSSVWSWNGVGVVGKFF